MRIELGHRSFVCHAHALDFARNLFASCIVQRLELNWKTKLCLFSSIEIHLIPSCSLLNFPLIIGRMIRFILLQNRQGKTRLAKYYVPLEDSEKHKVEYEVHRLVVNRDPKFTNFVEFRTHKVIYRRYAGLFFSLCVDITDNELAYLECIHLFVEILDHFFSNVCELDLVFNFHKAIIERMGELEKLE
ncbi:hypothetical protein I3842_08G067400 [Carya illinoinensis]|uniref:AP complex mu/sigma subunit domain-containing protein n=2 Tax=Carya illinoinensis TaxID=32201 RepID=A0A922EB71_CARIL|nr:hypothetical protein I3842_08G067400 [Carya illinoinensis]KAG6699447.1 hypothetical protein I3842_08G067400 [Carya illinoinensis]